jgi:fibronectin type III domain protein
MRQRPTLSKRTFIATAFAILLLSRMVSAATLTIAWDRNPEPDIAGYRISYGTVSGAYTNTVDVGNRLEYQIRGVDDGQKYFFVVRAYNTGGAVSPPSSEISANVVALTALATDMVSPTPTGKPITWTALAGSGAQLQYQFWRFSQSTGAWTLGQDYSSSNSFTWTPGAEGTYAIQVWARKAGSSATLEAWRTTGSFTVANRPIVVGSLEADVALPASEGTSITWTARATGGPPPLQYQFWRYDERTAQWVMARDYGTSNTYSWMPGAADLGQHSLQVWVRGAGSSASFDAWRSSGGFEVRNAPASIGSITASKSFPAGTGDAITWKTVAAGLGPLEYSYYLYSQTTNTWTVQSWGPSSSYTWTPTSAGNYWLQVWVRRQGSTAPYDAFKNTELFQITNGTPVVRALTSDLAAPVGTETPVTFAVDATGGPGALQYSFWLYSQARDSWSLVRPYGSGNKFTWTPTLGDQGDYVLQAWVRRATSTASSEAWGSSAFTVGNLAPTVQSLKIDSGNAVLVGTPLSVVARASGGPGNLEYRFFRYSMTTQSWTLVQDYSWDNSFGWVPGPLDRGLYTFQVWVRRAGSSAAVEAFLSSQTLQVN